MALHLIQVPTLSSCLPVVRALASNPGAETADLLQSRDRTQTGSGSLSGRLAARLLVTAGLADRIGDRWMLTNNGGRFARAGDADLPARISEDQAEIARGAIFSQPLSSLAWDLLTALDAVTHTGTRNPGADFERRLAELGDWEPATARRQASRYAVFLQDLRLITDDFRIRQRGRELLEAPFEKPDETDADDADIHLLLKWSERHGRTTIEDHRHITDEHGETWWAVIGRADRRKLAPQWREAFERQLERGVLTHGYIAGPTCWVTDILDITEAPEEVEEALAPASEEHAHSLWVKLTNFRPVERRWLSENLDLASSAGTPLSPGALGNQTNPLVVRPAGPRRAQTRRVWWVNQARVFASERELGIMWAPKLARDGSGREFWRALEDVSIGDLVLHYVGGAVRAVSEVSDEVTDARRPDGQDDRDGLLVSSDYRDLQVPLRLEDIPLEARLVEGGPFDRNGRVIQGYFFPLSDGFVNQLARDRPELGLQSDDHATLIEYTSPSFGAIATDLRSSGLLIDDRTLRRYHASLSMRGFVILAGVSGGGKTWLADAYARAIGAVPLVIPVAPNWMANEDLIGFAPALGGEYRHTSFSRFLQRAAAEHASAEARGHDARPYHLILDEMNLARVEYYFAKFLSAMEQRSRDGTATIHLSDELSVPLTPNLKFIGTVNVDETTFGFADKVYDRAQLIELGISRDQLATFLADHAHGEVLLAVWDIVRDVAPFAFRVAKEIESYVASSAGLAVPWEEALDEQVLQKILPKLKGTDARLGDVLRDLVALTEPNFPLSAQKAAAMLDEFETHGLASYF